VPGMAPPFISTTCISVEAEVMRLLLFVCVIYSVIFSAQDITHDVDQTW